MHICQRDKLDLIILQPYADYRKPTTNILHACDRFKAYRPVEIANSFDCIKEAYNETIGRNAVTGEFIIPEPHLIHLSGSAGVRQLIPPNGRPSSTKRSTIHVFCQRKDLQ